MMKRHAFLTAVAAVLVAGSTINPTWAREPVKSLADLKPLEKQVMQVAAKVMPSTVALVAEKTGASGSGVITTADGLILTAAHVVQGVDEMSVVFPNGKKVTGKVLGANYSKDIGMVKIQEPGAWPFVERGDSKKLEAGDRVVAMGHSAGFDLNRTPPVRFGQVVSKGPGNFFTTDCTLIGGDSGGPIFDMQGRIIGINSSIGTSLHNNNHAGIDGFREDWDRLLGGEMWGELSMNPFANPESPVLGIEMDRDTASRHGVGVKAVTAKSPAASAGVRIGDEVVAIDTLPVTSGRELQLALAKRQAGEKIKLGVLRDRTKLELDVTLIKRETLYDRRAYRGPMEADRDDEERDVPLILPAEREAVAKATGEYVEALKGDTAPLADSVVWVYSMSKQVSYGTVIGDGHQILTKWSQIAADRNALVQIMDHSGAKRLAHVTGVYEDEDLAVLAIDGTALTPVKWSAAGAPEIGRFLVAPTREGKVGGFGVVSVAERSLRESSQAYLGVGSDISFPGPGVKVDTVEPKTGAAAAGLAKGDLILKLGDHALASLAELRALMLEKKPGDHVDLHVSRGGKDLKLDILLGNLPLSPQPFNPRLRQMEQMGGDISRVRDAFPRVIQTDMPIKPEQCGGPVVDLAGNVIGISIARADRTRSLIVPAAEVVAMLKRPAVDAAIARIGPAPLEGPQLAGGPPTGRSAPGAPEGRGPGGPGGAPGGPSTQGLDGDHVRRHVRDIQRLLDRLHDEMDRENGVR